MPSSLEIIGMKISVFLGTTTLEQSTIQPITVDLKINFKSTLVGCYNDKIEDAVCYDVLYHKICDLSQKKKFFLIEHLCFYLISRLDKEIKIPADIYLKINKIKNLSNTKLASFEIFKPWE